MCVFVCAQCLGYKCWGWGWKGYLECQNWASESTMHRPYHISPSKRFPIIGKKQKPFIHYSIVLEVVHWQPWICCVPVRYLKQDYYLHQLSPTCALGSYSWILPKASSTTNNTQWLACTFAGTRMVVSNFIPEHSSSALAPLKQACCVRRERKHSVITKKHWKWRRERKHSVITQSIEHLAVSTHRVHVWQEVCWEEYVKALNFCGGPLALVFSHLHVTRESMQCAGWL